MKQPNEKPPEWEPPELGDLLQRLQPELQALRRFRHQGVPLAELARRTAVSLCGAPPPAPQTPPGLTPPWWGSSPATCLAALLCHVGLAELREAQTANSDGLPPHEHRSARSGREALRRLEVPFTVREHAVALIRNYRKPENLIGSGSPDETYLRLACRLDLRSLHALRFAELENLPQGPDHKQRQGLETFRQRAESLGVFGSLPPSPLRIEEIRRHGFRGNRARHRIVNALRFFRLKADVSQTGWFRRRLEAPEEKLDGELHLLIGPAGSGKSSWARQHLSHTQIVSSDRMREELTGDPSDQSQNYLVFERCMTRIRHYLHQGEKVTFDATNYREDLREQPVQTGRWCGAHIHSYLFDIGLETALARNRRRSRRVPESVIQRHFRLLTPPALYEADRHHVVDGDGDCHLYWPRP